MAEMCLELVRDFKHIVDTLPESIDTSTAGAEVPPILSCGDRSIADRAVTMLQVIHVFMKQMICDCKCNWCPLLEQRTRPPDPLWSSPGQR